MTPQIPKPSDGIEQALRDLIAKRLQLPIDDLGSRPEIFRTAGWDSLATIEIIADVEARFEIEIINDEVQDCCRLNSLVVLVARKRNDE